MDDREVKAATRRCRECVACCAELSVDELNKPAGRECEHCTARGCSIYAARPGSCRTFRCAWLQGLFADKDRPDRIGVIFAAQETAVGQVLVAFELWLGASLEERPARYIANARRGAIPVVIFHHGTGKRSIIADHLQREQVDELIANVRSARGHEVTRMRTTVRPLDGAATDPIRVRRGPAKGGQ